MKLVTPFRLPKTVTIVIEIANRDKFEFSTRARNGPCRKELNCERVELSVGETDEILSQQRLLRYGFPNGLIVYTA